MFKILTVFGTRPEVIKMAPVIKELKGHPGEVLCKVCLTGQHRQMVEPLLELFNLKADFDLSIMQENQTLEHITSSVLAKVGTIIGRERPDYLLVQGDTTTAMAASLAAFYNKVKVAHIEAGLRTGDKSQPYPEEVNRKIIDNVSDLFFAHTESAKKNLLREGVNEDRIEVTGNTVVDALLDISQREFNLAGTPLEGIVADGRKIILVTAHRRESFGPALFNIFRAIRKLARRYPQEICFVYPVHLNPIVHASAHLFLKGLNNVFLIKPLEYLSFVNLMKMSYFIMTDSGGIQEEAASLGKPILIIRETTERPEIAEAGAAEIVGTDTTKIIERTVEMLDNRELYERMSSVKNPYGDGKASLRIVSRLLAEDRADEEIKKARVARVKWERPVIQRPNLVWPKAD